MISIVRDGEDAKAFLLNKHQEKWFPVFPASWMVSMATAAPEN